MGEKYKVYDKRGNHIGTAVASDDTAAALVGCFAIILVAGFIFWPYWAFYVIGRDGHEKSSIYARIVAYLTIGAFVVVTLGIMTSPSYPNLGSSLLVILILAASLGLAAYLGYLKRPVPVVFVPQEEPGQYKLTSEGIVRIDDTK